MRSPSPGEWTNVLGFTIPTLRHGRSPTPSEEAQSEYPTPEHEICDYKKMNVNVWTLQLPAVRPRTGSVELKSHFTQKKMITGTQRKKKRPSILHVAVHVYLFLGKPGSILNWEWPTINASEFTLFVYMYYFGSPLKLQHYWAWSVDLLTYEVYEDPVVL